MNNRFLIFILVAGLNCAGATPEELSFDKSAFLTAVKKEDPKQYSQVMRIMLTQRNVREFFEALLFRDADGNNLFHLMAGVQSEPASDFFTAEMQALHDLFVGDFGSRESFVLGDTVISIPRLSNTPISTAFRTEWQWEDSDSAKTFTLKGNMAVIGDIFPLVDLPSLEKELDRLRQAPVIELIMALYAKDSLGRPFFRNFLSSILEPETNGILVENLIDEIKDHSMKGHLVAASLQQMDVPMGKLLEELQIKGRRFAEKITEISQTTGFIWRTEELSQISRTNLNYLLRATNRKEQRPIDTALYAQNTQAYDFLKTLFAPSHPDIYTSLATGVVGAVVGLSGYEISLDYNPSLFDSSRGFEGIMVALGAGLSTGLAVHLCRKAVRKGRIRRMEHLSLKNRSAWGKFKPATPEN